MKYALLILILVLMMGTVAAQCTDTDGGKNKYELGTVTDEDGQFQDECEDENIREYFCSVENVASYTMLPCVNGCDEGKCLVSNTPPRLAPEDVGTEENTALRIAFYGIVIIIIVAIYIWVFHFRRKR